MFRNRENGTPKQEHPEFPDRYLEPSQDSSEDKEEGLEKVVIFNGKLAQMIAASDYTCTPITESSLEANGRGWYYTNLHLDHMQSAYLNNGIEVFRYGSSIATEEQHNIDQRRARKRRFQD